MQDELDSLAGDHELSLLEVVDHVLDRGLVIDGEIIIAVADVDLLFLGLNVIVGSVEGMARALDRRAAGTAAVSGAIHR